MNLQEAKNSLLLYRPGTADAEDPQIAEALALAKRDQELARWLAEHCARQDAMRAKFRQIPIPAGLKGQIISEQAAKARTIHWRSRMALAATAVILLLAAASLFWLPRHPGDDTLAVYRNQMASIALRGYGMDLTTNDPVQIRAYLAQKRAPADYVLPEPLQKAAIVGCTVQGWQDQKVAMICFRTGRALPSDQASDLWLFVVDRASVKDAPEDGQTRIVTANRLVTAVWSQGDKVYLLGAEGDEATLRAFL